MEIMSDAGTTVVRMTQAITYLHEIWSHANGSPEQGFYLRAARAVVRYQAGEAEEDVKMRWSNSGRVRLT